MTITQQFEYIINCGRIDDLLPFFQDLDRKEYLELKKTVKKLFKYYDRDSNASSKLKMLSMAVLAISDTSMLSNIPSYFFYHFVRYKKALDLLEITRPANLLTFLKQEGIDSYEEYQFLRELLNRKLIEYDKDLFVQSLIKLTYSFYASTENVGRIGYSHFEKYVLENDYIYNRDLPLIFDIATDIHFYETTGDRKKADYSEKSWQKVIAKLIELNHWNKQETLQKCLEVLKKDWKQNLINWFKNLYLSLSPSNADSLNLQTEFCYLLSIQNTAIINFSVNELKKISLEKDFDTTLFLKMSAGLMHRNDCKTAIKTVLGMYEKMALVTENRNQICQNTSNCLLIDDLAIQEKAAKLIEKYGDVSDADFCQNLDTFSSNLKGDLRKHLTKFSATENQEIVAENIEVVEKYEILPQIFERIRADNALQIPDNWNDFMFHIGKVLSAENLAIDIEIFLQAFDNLYDTFPADYKTQLKPYTKQTEGGDSGMTMDLFCGFINHWTSDQSQDVFRHKRQYQSTPDNIKRLRGRFRQLYLKKIEQRTAPFMAAITHAPHWISPLAFVERLLWYQENNQPLEMYDMCVGICRVALENCESALQLAQKLNEKERIFAEYFLGNGPMPTLENDETKDIYTILAARTKNPDGYFPEFENLPCANYPNVVKPFELKFAMKKVKGNYSNVYYNILKVDIGDKKEIDGKFLYDLDHYKRENLWENKRTVYDFEILSHQIPNFTDPLYFQLAKQNNMPLSDDVSANNTALHKMFENDFVLRDIHLFFLAQISMNAKKVSRSLVSEILIHTIQNQAIDINLLAQYIGQLVSKNYAGLQRPLETLGMLKDVSPLHNIALKSIYEGVFAAIFNEKEIPKNTKKLLEDYFDVLIKTKSKPNENLTENLRKWSDNATLKKIATSVLDLGGVKISAPKRQIETRHALSPQPSSSQENTNIRKFIFNEGTSNKFWQIACSELSFTVTFGKVGTAGQQQSKDFNSPEACQKEATKLISEKMKKGYKEE